MSVCTKSACNFLLVWFSSSGSGMLGCVCCISASVHLAASGCVCGEPLSAVTIRPGMTVHLDACGPKVRFWFMHPVQLGHQIFGFSSPVCLFFAPPRRLFLPFASRSEVAYAYTRCSFSEWRFVRLHTPNSPTSSCVPFPFDWKGPPVFLLEATTPVPGPALPACLATVLVCRPLGVSC